MLKPPIEAPDTLSGVTGQSIQCVTERGYDECPAYPLTAMVNGVVDL